MERKYGELFGIIVDILFVLLFVYLLAVSVTLVLILQPFIIPTSVHSHQVATDATFAAAAAAISKLHCYSSSIFFWVRIIPNIWLTIFQLIE